MITKMKKLTFLVYHKEYEAFLAQIRELGVVHVVECQKIENGEFDWMFRFAEDEEDPYYYCFKDEGIHIIYHRFLPEDYREFGV